MIDSSPVSRVGDVTSEMIRQIGSGASLVAQALGTMLRPPPCPARILLQQCFAVGVGSIPVVLITGLFTGMVLALQSANAFARFSAEDLIGTVVSLSMVRELGPVLTGLMVAGRSGSSMAAELGTMRVTEQIDALISMATDPIRFLVVPRIIAAVIMLPCLVLFADLIGIVGGWVVAVRLLGNNPALYERRTLQYLDIDDLIMSLVKAAVFGAVLAAVSCVHGFSVKGGAREVGAAVTRSVVISVMGILFFNYLLTAWLS